MTPLTGDQTDATTCIAGQQPQSRRVVSFPPVMWAQDHAPTENPSELLVLLALARSAEPDGTGARVSVGTLKDSTGKPRGLAARTRLGESTIKRALDELENKKKIIRRGDQSLTAHLPADRRPTVWDLVIPPDELAPYLGDGGPERAPVGGNGGSERAPVSVSGGPERTVRGSTAGGTGVHSGPRDNHRDIQEITTRARETAPRGLTQDHKGPKHKIVHGVIVLTEIVGTDDWACPHGYLEGELIKCGVCGKTIKSAAKGSGGNSPSPSRPDQAAPKTRARRKRVPADARAAFEDHRAAQQAALVAAHPDAFRSNGQTPTKEEEESKAQ